MGYESLKALLQMPLAAIDFAANGGTNFAKLELYRGDDIKRDIYSKLAFVGHSVEEMTILTNQLLEELGDEIRCKQIIISGGISNFLDGYFFLRNIKSTAIYGQASAFLKRARGQYEELFDYVHAQVEGLKLAKAFLRIK